MNKKTKTRAKKVGLSPGTLVHTGEKKAEATQISIVDYRGDQYTTKQTRTVTACEPFKDSDTVTWINVDGLHEVTLVEQFGKKFDLHPLILEDVVNTTQRPKLEDYEQNLYVVLKMIMYDTEHDSLYAEQLSLILGRHYVLTFQEAPGDVFDPLRERMRVGKGRLRKLGADYLLYALIDCVVDHYFVVLEKMGERIEVLQEEIENRPDDKTLQQIHRLRREMIFLRKAFWPARELIGELQRSESDLRTSETDIYFRDLYDHIIRVIETTETYRDMLSGMFDMYLSIVSNRMNEVMKVLTIIATIFIPLTFIAGIYGMNFKYMPELEYRWAYPLVWGVMIIAILGMVVFFRKKKWL